MLYFQATLSAVRKIGTTMVKQMKNVRYEAMWGYEKEGMKKKIHQPTGKSNSSWESGEVESLSDSNVFVSYHDY